MTTFIEKLDDILRKHEENVPTFDRVASRELIKKSILSLVSERIIGENEAPCWQCLDDEFCEHEFKDEFRVKQRTTLYEGTKKEEKECTR